MQAVITLIPESPVFFDFNYYPRLAAALYAAIRAADVEFADVLHDGAEHKNRIKLFGFSPLHSRQTEIKPDSAPKKDDGGLLFKGPTSFRLCSPWPELLNRLADGLLKGEFLRIGSQLLRIAQAELLPPPDFSTTMQWIPAPAASVVTTWTDKVHKNRKTCVLPDDPLDGQTAEQLLAYNLFHKWQRLGEIRPDITTVWNPKNQPILLEDIQIQLLALATGSAFKTKFHLIKGNPVKSWIAPIQLTAPPPIQRIAWACGLGEMNSMGFGVVQQMEVR
ncbi:MAG: CRISPR-associated endoribonuclease Cas6 [Kiritimatiellae bacterium]|nr:CRISPR-associated endoribonuclease Cas6 [Kiritimatiellia bacterium]